LISYIFALSVLQNIDYYALFEKLEFSDLFSFGIDEERNSWFERTQRFTFNQIISLILKIK